MLVDRLIAYVLLFSLVIGTLLLDRLHNRHTNKK